jgi:hypothetical protein
MSGLAVKPTQGAIWIVRAEQPLKAPHFVHTLAQETVPQRFGQVEQGAIQ